MIFLDVVIGTKFLWYSNSQVLTRLFFDNFLLYISLLISIFSAFVIFNIKQKNSVHFVKYIFVLFIIVILLFQIFVPKPDAETVLTQSINYMFATNQENMSMNGVISLKSLSSRYIVNNTKADMVYFIPMDQTNCGSNCVSYNVMITDASLFDFRLHKAGSDVIIYYKFSDK